MRKMFIYIVILIAFCSLHVFSQEITIGLRSGLGFSGNYITPSYSGIYNIINGISDSSKNSKPVFSFHAGFLAGFLFNGSNIGFELQFNYFRYGAKIKNEIASIEDKIYIDSFEIAIPLKLSLLIGKIESTDVHHPYILIGPVFSLTNSSKLSGSSISSYGRKFIFGILFTLGGRLRVTDKSILSVELCFKSWLTDYFKTRGVMRNYGFYFNLVYEFNFKRSEW